MKLSELTWHAYRIPFRDPFVTAHSTLNHRIGMIVQIKTDEGYMGHGEIAPLAEFSGTSLEGAQHALPWLARELRGRELADILRFLENRCGDDVAANGHGRGKEKRQPPPLPAPLLYGLETALLDALGWASGQNLATLLANDAFTGQTHQTPIVPRTSIPVNAVIGGSTTEIAVAKAQVAIAAGFTCLKLKITGSHPETIKQHVSTIRAAIGPTPRLRLDANEGWDFAQARSILAECANYDIQYIEQPLPAYDLSGMARLRGISPIPIAADEALSSHASARAILDSEAADVLILKPQLLGGLYACRQVIQEACQRQVACVLTSTLETGIGVTAALHLAAASPEITLPCGLATLDLLANSLLQIPPTLSHGSLSVPPDPGLGVQLESEALHAYAL